MFHRASRLLSHGVGFFFLGSALLGLSGCNLVAASLFGEETSPPLLGTGVELSVRPVPAIFDAAARAPQALEKLRAVTPGRFSDFLSPEQRAMLRGELLSGGLIVPIPMGSLTIRSVAKGHPTVEVATVRSLAEVVGAYTAGERLLILDADGNFVLSQGKGLPVTGSFGVLHGGLMLKLTDGQVVHLRDTRPGSYVDERGFVFALLQAPESPADRPAPDYDSDDSLLEGVDQ